jgi:cytochrome c-type biogenesis protein CcsB
MSSIEATFFWVATVALALTFFMGILALVFKKTAALKVSLLASWIAFAALTIFGIIRWSNSGHPPFVTIFESMTISVWFALLLFHLLRIRLKTIQVMLLPLSLFGFLLLGWASSTETVISPLSEALKSTWLFIHASFATAGAATFLMAASFSAIYLMGEKRLTNLNSLAAKIPAYSTLPKSILNLVIFGLVLWGVMIVSGSIWAHNAWGRYWAWDPIELWSLISWLLYGLILHARMAFKLPQRVFCRLTIVAVLTIAFALWGVGYIYETIHTYG